jgi:hypothetical protein
MTKETVKARLLKEGSNDAAGGDAAFSSRFASSKAAESSQRGLGGATPAAAQPSNNQQPSPQAPQKVRKTAQEIAAETAAAAKAKMEDLSRLARPPSPPKPSPYIADLLFLTEEINKIVRVLCCGLVVATFLTRCRNRSFVS